MSEDGKNVLIECACGEDLCEHGEDWCFMCRHNIEIHGWCKGMLVELRNVSHEAACHEDDERRGAGQGTAPIVSFNRVRRNVWRPRPDEVERDA